MRQYEAAIVSLNNTLSQFPDTDYREEITFVILQSSYYLAINSIEEKKLERLNSAIEAYYNFIDNFGSGKYVAQAEKIFSDATKEKEKIELNKQS